MSVLQSVESTAFPASSFQPAPREVIEHALSLRTAAFSEIAADDAIQSLGISEALSLEDSALFRTRVFGRLTTKLAIGSHYADGPSLVILTDDNQKQELQQLFSQYAAIHAGEDPAELLKSADDGVLNDIPHSLVRSWVYSARRAEIGLGERAKAVWSYLNVKPGSYPPQPYFVKPMGNNDVTLVQAFGRDTVTDEGLVTIRDKRQELGSDTAMMYYLDNIRFQPGPSNIALAEVVADQLRKAPIEQVLQWEVTYALYARYPLLYERYENYIHTLWPHTNAYRTFEVKRDSIEVMDKFGLYNPAELAHGDMMARAMPIINKLGVQADPIAANIPYDPLSTQPYVRDAKTFTGREALVRGEHLLFGRVSF
jgi:hypothetical protein